MSDAAEGAPGRASVHPPPARAMTSTSRPNFDSASKAIEPSPARDKASRRNSAAGGSWHEPARFSAEDFARVNDLYRACFRQVCSIIAQSEPSERVVLASRELLPLDQPVPTE